MRAGIVVDRGAQLVRRCLCQRHGVVGMLAAHDCPVSASMRRTPEATALSPVTEIRPISPVRRTWVPPHNSDRPAERVAAVLAIGLTHRYHADLVAVLFAEQRACAGFAGVVHRHQPAW